MEDNKLIKVRNLKTYFPIKAGVIKKTVGHVLSLIHI